MNVYAVEEGFDAAYYANRYPDVLTVFENNEVSLYYHYSEFGKAEGRFKNAAEESAANAANAGALPVVADPNVAAGVPAETPIEQPLEPVAPLNLPYPTYVDVDIDNQLVTYYENGLEVIKSPCVTGNVSSNRSTPKGTYKMMTHTNGKTLRGPTWKCWVDYWMRFTNNAIGLHDATWRDATEFGGQTYLTKGSHGCVNLPHEFAKDLFNRVNTGTIVVVH